MLPSGHWTKTGTLFLLVYSEGKPLPKKKKGTQDASGLGHPLHPWHSREARAVPVSRAKAWPLHSLVSQSRWRLSHRLKWHIGQYVNINLHEDIQTSDLLRKLWVSHRFCETLVFNHPRHPERYLPKTNQSRNWRSEGRSHSQTQSLSCKNTSSRSSPSPKLGFGFSAEEHP